MSSQAVRCFCLVSLLIGVSSGSSGATIYTFATVEVPGAFSTEATGINDAGQIVGTFFGAMGQHGFLKDGETFTTIDFPGADSTFPTGINNAGQIVGYGYFGGRESLRDSFRGFLKDGETTERNSGPRCSL